MHDPQVTLDGLYTDNDLAFVGGLTVMVKCIADLTFREPKLRINNRLESTRLEEFVEVDQITIRFKPNNPKLLALFTKNRQACEGDPQQLEQVPTDSCINTIWLQ